MPDPKTCSDYCSPGHHWPATSERPIQPGAGRVRGPQGDGAATLLRGPDGREDDAAPGAASGAPPDVPRPRAASSVSRVTCGWCRQSFKSSKPLRVGKIVPCPGCGQQFRVEAAGGATVTASPDRPVEVPILAPRPPSRATPGSPAPGVSGAAARPPDETGRYSPTITPQAPPYRPPLPVSRNGSRSERALSPPLDLLPNIPGYEILSELGRGGTAVVYKARQLRLNRLCALKMSLSGEHTDAKFRARFLAEAETIARLRHPNIVQIYSLGEHGRQPYFEMEYVEGGSLAQRLTAGPWAPRPAAQLVMVLARAIAEAHRLGIVHRDLKPANVLLMADGTPKVADFGLAKSLEAGLNLTQSGIFFGTPSYAAPEQAKGLTKAVGPAADIYALGAIFYHLLTGRPPFQAATVMQTLKQVEMADPVPPSRLQPGLPRDVETIALKCLNKDPQRRCATAAALAEDLDRFLSGKAILARPTGAAERLWKWTRRRPAVALLSAAVVAVTVLGFALVSWQWQRAEQARLDAVLQRQRAEQVRLVAVEEQAQLALNQGLALCDQAEVGRGLLWLARSLAPATEAKSEGLAHTARVNLADWSSQLSQPRKLLPMRHAAPILGLAFRCGGRTLISVGKDCVTRTWDTATGKEVAPPLKLRSDPGDDHRFERATFGPPESNLLVAVDDRGRATFWDVDRRQRWAFPREHPSEHRIRDIAFSPDFQRFALSPDGRTLVTGGHDRRVIRWDVATGRPLEPKLYRDSPIAAIALTPAGRKVITGTQAGRLHVWDVDSNRGFDLPPQGTEVMSLAVSSDGRVFASGTQAGIARLWDTTLLGQIGQTYKLASAVTSLAFNPDGQLLALGDDDGTIRLWEAPRQKALDPPLQVDNPVQTVFFGKDGKRLLIGSTEGAQWWDLTTRTACGPLMQGEHKLNRVEATVVSPDGRTLATARCAEAEGRVRGWVEIWDVATGAFLRQTPEQPHALTGVAYSPDSQRLLTRGPEPKTARLWDVATLRDGRPLFQFLSSPIHQAVFSRDGRTLLLGCRDCKARLWDPERDEEIKSPLHPRHAYPITAVAFDPNRSRVATGCHAGTVRVWDATAGKMLNESRDNAGEIVVLAFSPDGTMLLTASCDGTARFLDAETGKQLGPSLHHTDAVLCAAFHPDGQSVVTGTRDGIVQRWHLPLPPLTGAVAEIRRRVQEQTGMELDDRGIVTVHN